MAKFGVKSGKLYAIGEAALKVGLSVPTLRLYEKEGMIIPHKTKSSRRFYSVLDLKIIRVIHRMIQKDGLNFAGVRRLLALLPCWDLKPCCEGAYGTCAVPTISDRPCWSVEETICRAMGIDCRACVVYARAAELPRIKTMIHRRTGSAGQNPKD